MDNIFKRVMKATLMINDEDAPPEPDPVADILQKALAAKESLPKIVMQEPQPVLEVPNRVGAQKSVPRDPLVRLIQETGDSDTEVKVRTQISGAINSLENVEAPAANNDALPVNKPGKQAQTSVILPAVNSQPVAETAAIQAKQQLNNEAALKGENPDFGLKPIGKTAIPVQPDKVNNNDTTQTSRELLGNQAQAKSQEPAQNIAVKSLPATEASSGPVSSEKTAQAKQVKAPPKKGDTGGIMDIFMEEEKKEKNEALSAGLENIESQKLLDQAEDILAVLKIKANH